MTFDDLLHKGEPDASAGFLPVGRVVEPLEDPEDLVIELGFDPDAVVPDVKDVPLRAVTRIDRLSKTDFHGTLGLVVVFDGVGYEIAEYFGDPRLVADNARQRARDNDARMPLGEHGLHHQADFVDDGVEIGFLYGELGAPEPREIEEIVDQPLHALAEMRKALETAHAVFVQLVLVILEQEGGVIEQAAQRLLQVMRCDIGEIVELLVAALELIHRPLQRQLNSPTHIDKGGDEPQRAYCQRAIRHGDPRLNIAGWLSEVALHGQPGCNQGKDKRHVGLCEPQAAEDD